MFNAAVDMVRKIEELGQTSGRVALYTAAREYFESVSAEDTRVVSGEVETFSMAVVVQILDKVPIDRDSENIRLLRIRTVMACVRQNPPAHSRSSTASASRGKIDKILTEWRATERSRSIQKDIGDALEANKQARSDFV